MEIVWALQHTCRFSSAMGRKTCFSEKLICSLLYTQATTLQINVNENQIKGNKCKPELWPCQMVESQALNMSCSQSACFKECRFLVIPNDSATVRGSWNLLLDTIFSLKNFWNDHSTKLHFQCSYLWHVFKLCNQSSISRCHAHNSINSYIQPYSQVTVGLATYNFVEWRIMMEYMCRPVLGINTSFGSIFHCTSKFGQPYVAIYLTFVIFTWQKSRITVCIWLPLNLDTQQVRQSWQLN